MTTFVQTPSAAFEIPDKPDLTRMRSHTSARLRAAMADRGVEALLLLGNNNVVYATGVSWPLGDAGLSYVERPVAVVLADDPWPHLFLPFREGAASESGLPADHLHGPVYLEFDEGVENFARSVADLIPARAVVAVDEFTGAMWRAHQRLFGTRRPGDAAQVIGAAKIIKTLDERPAYARHAELPTKPWSTCRRRWPPVFGRSICQPASCAGHSSWERWRACSNRSGR